MLPVLSKNYISPFIKTDLAAFYNQYGEAFITFLTAYYQWLEQPGNVLYNSRNILKQKDIDNTDIVRFTNTYFANNVTFKGDPHLFLKHVLDLYTSKGTVRSFKLFFQALYGKDVDVYIPNKDILRVSASKWFQPRYVEISVNYAYREALPSFIGYQITGSISNTTAIIEDYVVQYVNNKEITLFMISNITGSFIANEQLVVNSSNNVPIIVRGSLSSIGILNGGLGFNVGDILNLTSVRGVAGIAKVASVQNLPGGLSFTIFNGGQGYTQNATIQLVGGNGEGAQIAIGSLTNISTIALNLDKVSTYLSTNLNATAYGFPAAPTANLSSVISTALTTNNFTIGTIASLSNILPGNNYTVAPQVVATDPVLSTSGLVDINGIPYGTDAVIVANTNYSNGSITAVQIQDSGFGYNEGDYVILSTNTNPIEAQGVIQADTSGIGTGYWTSFESQLDSNKYIENQDYYQNYSYELQTSVPEEQYRSVLTTLIHPVGLARFSNFKYIDIQNGQQTQIYTLST